MTVCAKIVSGSSQDCENPIVAGLKDRLILINFDDFESAVVTLNGTNALIIENIVLPSGVVGYEFIGSRSSNTASSELVPKDFSELFTHKAGFKVFKNDGATKLNIEKIAKGRFVAIIENVSKGANGNSAYELLGNDAGIIATVVKRDANDDPTQGAYDIMLESSTKSLEPHVPKTIYKTSYATTKAIVDSLV